MIVYFYCSSDSMDIMLACALEYGFGNNCTVVCMGILYAIEKVINAVSNCLILEPHH